MKRRILVFFLSLTISHTYTNEQIFTNFITSPTSNQIYIPSRIWNSLPTWFSKNLFLNNLSLLARSIFVLQNGGAFLLEFPPWLEFRLENGRARPSPGNPSLHARNRNDSRSRDEIVSSLFRGAGRGRFTWIILVPLVNEYPSPRNKGQATQASSSLLESDIVLLSSRRSLHPTSRESGG